MAAGAGAVLEPGLERRQNERGEDLLAQPGGRRVALPGALPQRVEQTLV